MLYQIAKPNLIPIDRPHQVVEGVQYDWPANAIFQPQQIQSFRFDVILAIDCLDALFHILPNVLV